jgi:hypothetical protein
VVLEAVRRQPFGRRQSAAATQKKYRVYDEPHKDYLYTPAWVNT